MTLTKNKTSSAKRLVALVAALKSLDPSADQAIDLVHEGLFLVKNSANDHGFHAAALPVMNFWRNSLVKFVSQGYTLADVDDAKGAAMLWLYEQLHDYKVSETTGVAPYLRTRQSWFRSSYRMSLSPGIYSQGRYTVLGIVTAQKEKFNDIHKREPSLQELKRAVEATLYAQVRSKVESKPGNEKLSPSEVEKEVKAKLIRDGLMAAMDDFSAVLTTTAPTLYLNTDEDQDPLTTAAYGMVDMPQAAQTSDTMVEEDKYSKLLAVSLGDDLWADKLLSAKVSEQHSEVAGVIDNSSLRFFAQENKKDVKYLKTLLSLAKVRAIAPHAHWAHLLHTPHTIHKS